MKLRQEEEEIQKEMVKIRKEVDAERRKKVHEELQYGFTVSSAANFVLLFYVVCLFVFRPKNTWCVQNDMESLGLSQKDVQSRNK